MSLNLGTRRLDRMVLEIAYWTLVVLFLFLSIYGLLVTGYRLLGVSFFIFCLLIYGGLIEPRRITVKKYRLPLVPSPKVWLTVAFLSDFHAGGHKGKSFYDRVSRRTQTLGADIIILGGDLVDEPSSPVADLSSLQTLRAPLGKYFILGNHDYLDNTPLIREQVLKWGYGDITNQTREMEKDGRSLTLVAVDDAWMGAPELSVLNRATKSPRLLITHEPDLLLDVTEGQAEAVIMGHTHGGQVRVPMFGGVMKLPQVLPRSFDRGLKKWKNIPVVISQGLGEANSRARLFCPPQIVVLELGI